MRFSVRKHSCGISNMLQSLMGHETTECPFYWKMRGGDTYFGSLHFFTLLGYRVVFDLTIKKKQQDLWIK